MSGSHHDPDPTRYDLRTVQQREQDDAAQLALRLDNLLDAHEAMSATVASQGRALAELRTQLETITGAAMHDLSVESHRTEQVEGRVTALEQAFEKLVDRVQVALLQEGGQ